MGLKKSWLVDLDLDHSGFLIKLWNMLINLEHICVVVWVDIAMVVVGVTSILCELICERFFFLTVGLSDGSNGYGKL